MKSIVKVVCWHKSHITELNMNRTQEEKLARDIPKLRKVCPDCKPSSSPIVIVNGQTVFNPSKAYKCEKGHLSLLAPLGSMINVQYGPENDSFYNVPGSLDDIPKLIDDGTISCHYTQACGCKMVPIDDYQLSYPGSPAVKTKTRIGDLWDRHGIEPVRSGTYNDTGYNESKTQKANTKRLEKMKRDRNISKDRIPGTPLKKATSRSYERRNKSSLGPDRLE